MNIDEIKKECQITTHSYIVGLKFVTTETVDEVMSSIRRDINIYDDLCRFIIFNNLIEIGLCTMQHLQYITSLNKAQSLKKY